jgi:hypothetical protein
MSLLSACSTLHCHSLDQRLWKWRYSLSRGSLSIPGPSRSAVPECCRKDRKLWRLGDKTRREQGVHEPEGQVAWLQPKAPGVDADSCRRVAGTSKMGHGVEANSGQKSHLSFHVTRQGSLCTQKLVWEAKQWQEEKENIQEDNGPE